MKVTVIGSSTAWTNRPMSSYCLDGETLIDCGEGTTKYYYKCGVDFYNIKNIFITHLHGDHILGISQYLCQHCTYNDESKWKTLTIYGPKGLKKHLDILKIFSFGEKKSKITNLEDYINIVELENGSKVMLGQYEVDVFELQHGDLIDLAYIFNKDGKSIGFSGDCTYSDNLEKFAEKSQLCFLECCGEKTTINHLGYDKFVEIKNNYKNNRFIAIHCVDALYQNQDRYDIEFAIDGNVYLG